MPSSFICTRRTPSYLRWWRVRSPALVLAKRVSHSKNNILIISSLGFLWSPNFLQISVLLSIYYWERQPSRPLPTIENQVPKDLRGLSLYLNNRWLMKTYHMYGLYGWYEDAGLAPKPLKADYWETNITVTIGVTLKVCDCRFFCYSESDVLPGL